MSVLLVNILALTDPYLRIIVIASIRAHKDIFKGIWMPPRLKRLWDSYLVFVGSQERIEKLTKFYRMIFDKVGLKSRYLVQIRKRMPRNWECIVPPTEMLK